MLLTYGVFQINPQWLQGNILINETNVPSDTRLIYIPEVTADIDDTPVFSVKMRTDEAISGFSLKIHDFPELLDGMFDVELHSNLTSSYFSQFKNPTGLQYDAASNTYTLEDVYLDMTYPVQIAENQTIEIATITFNTPVTAAHIGTHPFKVDLLSSGHINEVQDIYGDDLVFNTHNGSLIVVDNSPAPIITINDASSPEGNIATSGGQNTTQSLSYIWGEKADRTTTTATPISPILNTEIDHSAEVVQDSQNNVYVLSIQGLNQTGPYYDVIMFNANGIRLREYNMHGWEPTIQIDNSDNLIIGAYTQQRPEDLDPTSGVDSKWAPSCANNSKYAYITTVDSQGHYLWSKYIDQSGGVVCSTKISDIEVDDQNNIFVSLYAEGRFNLSDTTIPTSSKSGMAIVKYDALGTYQWHQFWDNTLSGIAGSKHTYDMEIVNNAIYIEGQYQAQAGGGGVDFDFTNNSITTPTNSYQGITNEIAPGHSFIMKLSNGTNSPSFDWVKTIGQTEIIELEVSGNQIYAAGHIDNGGSTVALLRTYDLNGNALNTQTLNYAVGEYSRILDATVHNDTFIIIGRSRQDIDLDPSQTGDEFTYSGDGNCPSYLFSGNGNCENFFLAMYDQSLNYTDESYQWGGDNADRFAHISSNGTDRIYITADIGQNGGSSVAEEMDFTGSSDIETLTYIRAGVSALNYISNTVASNQMMFTITQTGTSNTPFTINWQTNADTATSNLDYTAQNGSLTFPPNSNTTQTYQIFIDILADNINEIDEYFFIDLSTNDTNVIIQDNQGIGTILDDDIIITTSTVNPVTKLLIKDYNTSTEQLTFQWRVPADNPSEYILVAKKMSDHGPEVFNERNGGDTPSPFTLRVNDSNPILKSDLTTIIENTNTPDAQNINAGDAIETTIDLYSWLPNGEDANDYFYRIMARELTTEAVLSDIAYRPGDVATAAPTGVNAVDYANIFISAPSQFYPDYLITSVDAQVTANHAQVGFIYNDNLIFNILAADTIDLESPGQNAIDKASPFMSPGSAIPDGQVNFVDALQIINQVQIGTFAKITDISYLLLE